ncbi:hypothetical protein OIU77_001697 [Salix suchowensis]|uniref:Uncharacterized protein n=1 Tax=Salix suchowensis TaxID=1278906 RepID=A0ABQ9B2C2_9ROSI|nr:hypothetical protein OIU77_001697 [Salix suchowensis]
MLLICETERRTLMILHWDSIFFSRKNSMFGCRTRFSLASYYNSNGSFFGILLKGIGCWDFDSKTIQ